MDSNAKSSVTDDEDPQAKKYAFCPDCLAVLSLKNVDSHSQKCPAKRKAAWQITTGVPVGTKPAQCRVCNAYILPELVACDLHESNKTACPKCGQRIMWKDLRHHKSLCRKPKLSSRTVRQSQEIRTGEILNIGSKPQPVPSREVCLICGGDGGVQGGCYKCDGTGWLTQTKQVRNPIPPTSQHKKGSTRVSNANYQTPSVGTSFRDPDGRIGSAPDHDDYSDEASS